MRILRATGWTKAQWMTLTSDEQMDHLAFDYHRQKAIQDVIDSLQTERPRPTSEQMKARTTTNSWEPGAAAALLIALLE